MYVRRSVRRKDGKEHVYWRLVRSVRRGGKVQQETVAQLGELDAAGQAKAAALARHVMGRAEQPGLFEEAPLPPASATVRLDQIRLERGRLFGNVWLGWMLWQALKLDEACERLMPEGREDVSWHVMAAVHVIARLCEPSSDLHLAERWYASTALDDLFGLPAEKVNDDRVYRALDKLLAHKEELERHLVRRLGELFDLEYDLLLYDVTSTYFEGLAEGNDMAKRGHSRDHRPDCKQVCIALVVTRGGMPLGYELFEGNRTDVTTVEEIVETMETRYGMAQRVWVMDRGMASEDNIAWLQETDRRYLIGTPRGELRKWSAQLRDERDWTKVRDGVEAKLCTGPDGKELFLLCRSADRQQKEKAMHERFAKRIEEGLTRLAGRLSRARKPQDRGTLERQVGRLLGRNSRAAARYRVHFVDDASTPAGVKLTWSVSSEWDEWAQCSEGCYVLRTNVAKWSDEELWRTYVQLSDAEAAFRVQKSDLSIRPVWHQTASRVKAHVLVCFLAYVLWKTLEAWQERAGLGNSPRVLLDELAKIQSADVVLPLADHPGREMRLRCVVRPEPHQAALLDRLGLRLPQRLKPLPSIATV
jgi:transposase